MEKPRARRRRDVLRMKERAIFWMRYILQYEEECITPQNIGHHAAMHCTHPCKMCNWYKHDGNNTRPISEQRRGIADDIFE